MVSADNSISPEKKQNLFFFLHLLASKFFCFFLIAVTFALESQPLNKEKLKKSGSKI